MQKYEKNLALSKNTKEQSKLLKDTLVKYYFTLFFYIVQNEEHRGDK
ncbi:MAG: hypothetical protein LBV43_09040 [Prevotella sp.]|nr:hypothetical protein [Prevotella sp.]